MLVQTLCVLNQNHCTPLFTGDNEQHSLSSSLVQCNNAILLSLVILQHSKDKLVKKHYLQIKNVCQLTGEYRHYWSEAKSLHHQGCHYLDGHKMNIVS